MSNLALRRSIKHKTCGRTSKLPNQKTVILKNCFGNKKTTKNLSSPSLLHITTYIRTTYPMTRSQDFLSVQKNNIDNKL